MINKQSYIKDKQLYSDMQVLHSGAGYYIGTMYDNPLGFEEPGSRDSIYYGTRKEAMEALLSGNFVPREHP